MTRIHNGKKYAVYCHTNKTNGKRYVGITCRKPEHRWNNGKGYAENAHFSRAIEKYGWDGFSHDILYEGLSSHEACAIEISLIKRWRLTDPDRGYNQSSGGEHGNPNERTRAKMSKSNKESSYWRGKHLPDAVKAKMSLAKKGYIPSNRTPKPVVCIDTGVVYKSGQDAANATGVSTAVISRCCHHAYSPTSRKPYKGLRFEFYEVD